MTTTDQNEMWRRRLGREPGSVAEPEAAEAESRRIRYLHIVARTRMDLLLTLRRRFRDDPSVHVMLDRRERDRRRQPSAIAFADRRQAHDRRRPREYWEDIAYHPAVIIPLDPNREPRDDAAAPEAPVQEAEAPEASMDPVLDAERMRAWIEETRHVVQRLFPELVAERDALRAELARITAAHRQLEQEHAEVTQRLGQFLTQIGGALGSLRDLQRRPSGAAMTSGTTALAGRILVVDSEPATAAPLRDALAQLGHPVKVALGGREALGLVPVFEPDVVLLDVALADRPASELLDQLQRLAPALPVVVVGTAEHEPEVVDLLVRGAVDRLTRPFSPDVVEHVVAAAIARRRS